MADHTMCSCGDPTAHTIARRVTADGIGVLLWDDGGVSGVLGYRLQGVPMRRPRNAESHSLALRAGRLFMDELCLWKANELGMLYAACESVAKRSGTPGDVRAEVQRRQEPVLRPEWVTLSADRDGRPTERVWRLPRLRWPGTVVWDHVSHPRGRYELAREIQRSGTFTTSGIHFARLRDLCAHLLTEPS